jgi:hypothetical protein
MIRLIKQQYYDKRYEVKKIIDYQFLQMSEIVFLEEKGKTSANASLVIS